MRAANFHTYLEKKNKIMGQQQDNDAGNETLIYVALSSLLSLGSSKRISFFKKIRIPA